MSINLEGYVRRKTDIELGGRTWVFTELALSDFAQFRAKIIKERRASLAEKRKLIIEEAKNIGEIDTIKLLELLERPITDEEMEVAAESVEGLGFLVYLSLKYHYPEVTEEDALKMVSIEKIPEITQAMMGGIETDKKKPIAPVPPGNL
jgi:hypothetical protein